MTVDESAGYEISSSGGGGDQEQYIEAGDDAISDGDGDGDGGEPEAVEPAEPIDGNLEAVVHHQREIAEASAAVAVHAVQWAKAQEAAKSAKKQFEAAVEDLRGVIGRGPEVMPLFDQAATKATPADPTDPTDEAWRETPISEIFLGIRGLGAKKREAIQAMIPTLGAFEDLRKKASLDGEPLKTYMPPGVGQEACDQLEEAALNWVSAHFYPADEDENEGGEA